MLSKEEFLDIFLEDLELPDLVKKKVQQLESPAYARAGFSVTGTPASLSLVRTMRNSLSRRIALRRPSLRQLQALENQIAALADSDSPAHRKRKAELETE